MGPSGRTAPPYRATMPLRERMRDPGGAYRPARAMERHTQYVMGGTFMLVVGTLAHFVLSVEAMIFATWLWLFGLIALCYGLWLRR
jgi:hypothetical protein